MGLRCRDVTGQRALVVDDEDVISDLVRVYLERDGYEVHVVDRAQAVAEALVSFRPDVVLLDIGLPDGPGTEVVRRMRAAGDWTPVLLVSARDDEVDRVVGLEVGADDYIVKPFSPRELVARVRAVLRRAAPAADAAPEPVARVHVGAVEIDAGARRVHVSGEEVPLTATEFDLLHELARSPGRVLTRQVLLENVWGHPPGLLSRTVDVHVAQLRAKLGDAVAIRSVRGVGYALDPPGRAG